MKKGITKQMKKGATETIVSQAASRLKIEFVFMSCAGVSHMVISLAVHTFHNYH